MKTNKKEFFNRFYNNFKPMRVHRNQILIQANKISFILAVKKVNRNKKIS